MNQSAFYLIKKPHLSLCKHFQTRAGAERQKVRLLQNRYFRIYENLRKKHFRTFL